MPTRKAKAKHKSRRSTKTKSKTKTTKFPKGGIHTPVGMARSSHATRSLISQKTDEALRAKKVPASEAGLKKWRGSRNRTDFPEVDTVGKPKTKKNKKNA